MAKVTLIAGITSLRGKMCAVYYRTNRNGTVSVCKMPKRGKKRVSKPQLTHRELFGKIASQKPSTKPCVSMCSTFSCKSTKLTIDSCQLTIDS